MRDATEGHTPTPWEITRSGPDSVIEDANGNAIATVWLGNEDAAALIVRAVNAHEALVDALAGAEGRLMAMATRHNCGHEIAPDIEAAIAGIREALALARGETEPANV